MGRKTKKIFGVTEEQVAKLQDDHKYLIEEFINYCKAEKKSDKTIKVYRSNLNIFFVWFEENCKVKGRMKHISQFKVRDLINFQSFMLNEDLSGSRIANIRATISSLFNYIESVLSDDDDFPEFKNFRNCVSKVKCPSKEKVREKTILNDDQIQNLLDMLVEEEKYQMACIVALAWASGRRKVELLEFRCSFIDDKNLKFGSLYKSPYAIQTKGKKLEVYVIKSKFKPYYDLWMKEREKKGISKDIDHIFIKVTPDGVTPLKETTLNVWANKISEMLEVDFYWHCLRHNFTTELLNQGLPESVVQQIIGWSSADMIAIYDDREKDDILGEYFKDGEIISKEVKELNDL